MNPKLKDYLQKFSPATEDQAMLDDLRQKMEKAVPEIIDRIKQREALAAELRIASLNPVRSKKEKQN